MLIILQWILKFSTFQLLNDAFSLFSVFKFELKKNWKFENWRWPLLASDIIMLLWLQWKPIKQQVVLINWKYKKMLIICAKYLVNRMNGVKNRGEGSDWPPYPLCFCVTCFSLCLLGLTLKSNIMHCKEPLNLQNGAVHVHKKSLLIVKTIIILLLCL